MRYLEEQLKADGIEFIMELEHDSENFAYRMEAYGDWLECRGCREFKLKKEFHNSNSTDAFKGKNIYCKECIGLSKLSFKIKSPEKYKNMLTRNVHKRNMMRRNNPHTIDPTEAIRLYKEVFGDICGLTGKPLESENIEHLLPVSKGGGNTEFNLYPAEKGLNISKNNRNVFEWIATKKDTDFSFFFAKTLPYLANQAGMTVHNFIQMYDEEYYKEVTV